MPIWEQAQGGTNLSVLDTANDNAIDKKRERLAVQLVLAVTVPHSRFMCPVYGSVAYQRAPSACTSPPAMARSPAGEWVAWSGILPDVPGSSCCICSPCVPVLGWPSPSLLDWATWGWRGLPCLSVPGRNPQTRTTAALWPRRWGRGPRVASPGPEDCSREEGSSAGRCSRRWRPPVR